MEELFPALIIIIGAIIKLVSSAKEKSQKAEKEQRHAAAFEQVKSMQQTAAARPKPAAAMSAAPQPAIPYQPAQPLITTTAQPQAHVHLQPDCDVHDAPGSLGVTSTEGKDPCHEDELSYDRSFAEPQAQEAGLTFNWTGDSMVKAFVMQEVLTRPAQRHAR